MSLEKRQALLVLRGARKRLEKGYIKGDFAKTAEGRSTSEYDPAATCFCSLGALSNAEAEIFGLTPGSRFVEIYADPVVKVRQANQNWLRPEVLRAGFTSSLVTFNDSWRTTKEDVLAVFDAAIAKAETELGLEAGAPV